MYYVQILACLMWIAVHTGSPFGSLGSLCSLASVHVESTCEISSILSLVPDSPNHPTCLPDRARRLPDMSPIRHQASLANNMNRGWVPAHCCTFTWCKQLIVRGSWLELTSSWPPARVEEIPSRSKWLTSGTAGTAGIAGRSGRSGDEFQMVEKHWEL